MKIYIDADGCPVVDLTINTAKNMALSALFYATRHTELSVKMPAPLLWKRGLTVWFSDLLICSLKGRYCRYPGLWACGHVPWQGCLCV